jgi:DinB family protein
MRVTADDVSELRVYLVKVRDLLPRLTLEARVGGGADAGQLAFHAGESADYWVRAMMLGDARPRDRDAEFAGRPTPEEVAAAVGRALEACDELVRRSPELDATSPVAREQPEAWTVLRCLIHATAHTAEHVGHLEGTLG